MDHFGGKRLTLWAVPRRRIFEIPQKNVQHIKQAQGLIDQFPGWVLRMRGLPYSATPDDVVRLSSPWSLHPTYPCWPRMYLASHGFPPPSQSCHAVSPM